MQEQAIQLAQHEVNWWKAHNEGDFDTMTEEMVLLYVLQFGVTPEKALSAVEWRVKAAQEHDLAEELEDSGNQEEADKHWCKAEEYLAFSFGELK